MIDRTASMPWYVAPMAALAAGSFILNLWQWHRGRTRARVNLGIGRGLRSNEAAVCIRIHNRGGRPIAPRALVGVKGRSSSGRSRHWHPRTC